MKNKYKRVDGTELWHRWYENCYESVFASYFRRPQTNNERRQNHHAICDGYKVRGKRRSLPSSYDDIRYSFAYGKCWKRFTKRKHQYYGAER